MSTPSWNRNTPRARNTNKLRALALALTIFTTGAHALSTDRNQEMVADSDYAKMQQGTDNQPGVNYLKGNVRIVQGSMKAHGDEATIYMHPKGAKDAQGNDVANGPQRVVLVGTKAQAHMQQLQDNGGGLITADANKIDYNSDTGVADLTGNVTVVQQGRGTFHGTHMTFNTNTGEMESGDNTPANRVHMIMLPKNRPAVVPAKPATDDKAAKPDAKPAATAPSNRAGKSDAAGGGQP